MKLSKGAPFVTVVLFLAKLFSPECALLPMTAEVSMDIPQCVHIRR